jgi:hypothetical protein
MVDCFLLLPLVCLTRNIRNVDLDQYYTVYDMDLLVNNFSSDLAFLTMNWCHTLGRPTFTKTAHIGMIGIVGLRDRLNTENFVDHKNTYILAAGSW